jgi:two-component system sensor histidine kinase KdpD
VEVAGEAPLVNVDATQIQRVLANLIENALKFSPEGAKVHVRITATRMEAIVRVVDQGPGLAEDELERVFEPFYRRETASSAGAGLGLAIARGFAAANGGRVWAESRPGQGASFALALPVVEVPAELRA